MSDTVAPPRSTVDDRLARVPRPTPLMSRGRAAQLTMRQRELLDDLTELIADGFSHLTMADVAAELGCSLRTLYGIAASRDELVLVACDRNLWSTGRLARSQVADGDHRADPLGAVRRYLHAATQAVSATTAAFAADLAAVPGGAQLNRSHSEYLVAITTELLDIAVESGSIAPVDTRVLARAMAGVSGLFIDPDVIGTLRGTPKEASDHVVDIILRGLAAPLDQASPNQPERS